MEACRIGIVLKAPGVVDVGAPMKYKEICYDMLSDARVVIAATEPQHFNQLVTSLTLTMDMTGRVDVAAPLPDRAVALKMLDWARNVIERYDDHSAPELRPFDSRVMGH